MSTLRLFYNDIYSPGWRSSATEDGYSQTFLLALPIGRSCSSSTMQTSSISRICSSSYPSKVLSAVAEAWLPPITVVLTSGKRRATSSEVGTEKEVEMTEVSVIVIVVAIVVAVRGGGIYSQEGGTQRNDGCEGEGEGASASAFRVHQTIDQPSLHEISGLWWPVSR